MMLMDHATRPDQPTPITPGRTGLYPFVTVGGTVWARPERLNRGERGLEIADDIGDTLANPPVMEVSDVRRLC